MRHLSLRHPFTCSHPVEMPHGEPGVVGRPCSRKLPCLALSPFHRSGCILPLTAGLLEEASDHAATMVNFALRMLEAALQARQHRAVLLKHSKTAEDLRVAVYF